MNLANFRELGGLENKDGKTVQSKRLLRSGEVYQLSDKTKDMLASYRLKKIVDLRGQQEIEKRPDDELPEVEYQWIDIMKEVHNSGSLNDLMAVGDVDAVDQHMLAIYDNLVLNEGAQAGYKQYFEELLATEEGSVLFHCFAGKDRTGVAAALTLELLDVPREAIYQDYLQTNIMRQEPNQVLYEAMKKEGMTKEQLASMKIALEVRKAYLERAYELIEANYGDVKSYAQQIYSLSNSDIQDLQKLYLV